MKLTPEQIAANARAPYAAKIKELETIIDESLTDSQEWKQRARKLERALWNLLDDDCSELTKRAARDLLQG